MSDLPVSIVLVTRNGAATLPGVLDAIATQRYHGNVETLAVDSGSTDGTLDLLGRRVGRVLRIPPERFNHGGTRNLAIGACGGELVVLLVQDAVPASDRWLHALTAPLDGDARLAGSYARQVPRPDAGPLARYALRHSQAASERPRVTFLPGAGALAALSPHERLDVCTFDNVSSCVRRAAWQAHPFADTPIAEDVEWARAVLLDGWGLAYAPEAVVVHSHERPARYELGRTYLVHHRLYELFGLATIPSPLHLVRAISATLVAHVRSVATDRSCRRRRRELGRALALGVVWPLGQYLGALAARRGRALLSPRGV